MRQFGVYEQALEALEDNKVKIVLRSEHPDGVANALAAMQKAVKKSTWYKTANGLLHFIPEDKGRIADARSASS